MSEFAKRGTKMVLCYFHYKKAWTDSLPQKLQGDALATIRNEIMGDLDHIVWTDVRPCLVFLRL